MGAKSRSLLMYTRYAPTIIHVPAELTSDQRRRAQNRASQRAFRDRKEKHTRELEQRLSELEGQHNDLSRSYESLQLEYTSVKQELDRLRKEREEPAHSAQTREWDGKEGGALDPVLFDVSAFCFDHGEETCQKEC